MKAEAIDRTLWRTPFGGGYEPDARQTRECMNSHVKKEIIIM
jgi:hypothetical protein